MHKLTKFSPSPIRKTICTQIKTMFTFKTSLGSSNRDWVVEVWLPRSELISLLYSNTYSHLISQRNMINCIYIIQKNKQSIISLALKFKIQNVELIKFWIEMYIKFYLSLSKCNCKISVNLIKWFNLIYLNTYRIPSKVATTQHQTVT